MIITVKSHILRKNKKERKITGCARMNVAHLFPYRRFASHMADSYCNMSRVFVCLSAS